MINKPILSISLSTAASLSNHSHEPIAINMQNEPMPPIVTNGFIQVGDLTPVEYENLTEIRHKNRFNPGPCAVCGQKNVKSGRERGVYLCFRCEVAVELVKRGVEAS